MTTHGEEWNFSNETYLVGGEELEEKELPSQTVHLPPVVTSIAGFGVS